MNTKNNKNSAAGGIYEIKILYESRRKAALCRVYYRGRTRSVKIWLRPGEVQRLGAVSMGHVYYNLNLDPLLKQRINLAIEQDQRNREETLK